MSQQALYNMIEQQIRPWKPINEKILSLLAQIPRQDYVPNAYQKLAYADFEIPLIAGETMLSPKIESAFLHLLDIKKSHKILEIGTGSGYFTACLAHLGLFVDSWELNKTLFDLTNEKFQQQNIHNIHLYHGNGLIDVSTTNYDLIVLTGSIYHHAPFLKEKLVIGGKMLVVIGSTPIMKTTLITRTGANAYRCENLFETVIKPLNQQLIKKKTFNF